MRKIPKNFLEMIHFFVVYTENSIKNQLYAPNQVLAFRFPISKSMIYLKPPIHFFSKSNQKRIKHKRSLKKYRVEFRESQSDGNGCDGKIQSTYEDEELCERIQKLTHSNCFNGHFSRKSNLHSLDNVIIAAYYDQKSIRNKSRKYLCF